MTLDQLDQQSAIAVNKIRRGYNDARRRLGLRPVKFITETAASIRARHHAEMQPNVYSFREDRDGDRWWLIADDGHVAASG